MMRKYAYEMTINESENLFDIYASSDYRLHLSQNTLYYKIVCLIKEGKELSYFKDELIKQKLLASIFKFTLHDNSKLTRDESSGDCVSLDILTNRFKKTKYFSDNIFKFAKLRKEHLIKELKDAFKHKLGFKKQYTLKELSESQFNILVNVFKMYVCENEDIVTEISNLYKKSFESWKLKKIATIKAPCLYSLNLNLNIEDVLKTKEVFTIKKYHFHSKRVNINGLYYSFGLENEENISINCRENGSSTAYIEKGTVIFFKKESALKVGKEKLKELKKVLSGFEKVIF